MNEEICSRCSHREVCYKYICIQSGKKFYDDYFEKDALCTDYSGCESVETNMFDVVEKYDDCVVEVLKNSITGEVSVGWYKKDRPPVCLS